MKIFLGMEHIHKDVLRKINILLLTYFSRFVTQMDFKYVCFVFGHWHIFGYWSFLLRYLPGCVDTLMNNL